MVTDIEMPGMDGFELTAHLRGMEHFAQLPIVVVSTRDRPEDRLRGLKVGADAYLTKQSLDAGELVDLVRRLGGSSADRRSAVIRVLLVDDSPSVRAVLRRFFSPTPRHRGGRARPRTASRPSRRCSTSSRTSWSWTSRCR